MGEDLSRPTLLRWLGNWLGAPAVSSLPLFALLFPDGRTPSERWRPVVWISAAGAASLALSEALRPAVIIYTQRSGEMVFPNPIGITGLAGVYTALGNLGIMLVLGSALLGTVALVVRFRRSRGIERQQLKWFVFAVGLLAGLFVAATLLSSLASDDPAATGAGAAVEVTWILMISSLSLLPLAAGIAILRYRLYDIDLVINRTLVYGSLTALLAGVFVGGQALLQRIFVAVTGTNSDLAVVLALFLIGTVFAPLRTQLQSFVDRRYKVLPAAAARVAPAPVDDDLVGSLERLAKLHRDGRLDDDEYSRAKARLLYRE